MASRGLATLLLFAGLLSLAAGHGALHSPRSRNNESSNATIPFGFRFLRTPSGVEEEYYNSHNCSSFVTKMEFASGQCVASGGISSSVSLEKPSVPGPIIDCTAHDDCTRILVGALSDALGSLPGLALDHAHGHKHGHAHGLVDAAGGQQGGGEAGSDGLVWLSAYMDTGCSGTPKATFKIRLGACTQLPRSSSDYNTVTGCEGMSCYWFSQGCTIGCPKCTEDNKQFVGSLCGSSKQPTINDPAQRTFNPYGTGAMGDWTKAHPWRAPGSAPVLDACGLAGGSSKNNDRAGGYAPPGHKLGDRGSELPPVVEAAEWTAGSTVEVSWGVVANHGGGYQYRLCPKSEPLTEECFSRTPLRFSGNVQWLQLANGTRLEFPATRVSEGTLPEGSEWTRNPVPACDDPSGGFQEKGCERPQFPPPKGCDRTCWGYVDNPNVGRTLPVIVDRLEVPAGLRPGAYVLGWRWDCEQTPQVWASCADVIIRPAVATFV